MQVVPFSPVASGLLSGKITTGTKFDAVNDVRKFVPQLTKENIAANQPILDLLAKYSALKNATSAQICLAWMLHKYPNVVPIPGSKNRERILENLGAWNVELTDAEFAELEQALDACTVFGTEAMWSRNRQVLERTGRRNKKEQVNKRFYFEGV